MIDWLTDTFIATSALILLVLLIREPVRRQFGATVAYALWLIPAARLLMPPLTRTVERVIPAALPSSSETAAFTLPVAAAPAVEPTLVEQLGGWPTILTALWLAGAAAMLVHGLVTYRRQRAAVLGCGVQLARLDRIRIVRSEAVRGPMAFGILDPVIVLPVDFDERYDAPQRRLALDHELAHHRSGDLVANLIAYVLLCLQWFNPLAWAAHAAFRFDQEAACDARVLDMADGPDRAAYGRAIAKAASGRALLFAGALDRPKTLSRRLNSMLISSNPRRRLAGKAMVLGAIAVALPLTATWATLYVDRIAPTPPVPTVPVSPAAAPLAPVAPLSAPSAVAPLAPVAPLAVAAAVAPDVTVGKHDISFIGEDNIRINGQTKRWDELTAEERARIRRETAKARAELQEQRRRLPQEMANAAREMEKFQNGEFEREMAEARREVAEALRDIDSQRDEMRRAGVDPEAIKAQVRASLREVEKIDVEKIKREALASIDMGQIEASLREAERELARVEANLDGKGPKGRK